MKWMRGDSSGKYKYKYSTETHMTYLYWQVCVVGRVHGGRRGPHLSSQPFSFALQLDKAPRLSIRIDIWIFLSDTVFVKLNQIIYK